MTGTVRNAVSEAFATLLFVFVIIAAVNSGSALTPIAIGFTLMVLVYATGHISGAHLNPAVSLAVLIRGAISLGDFIAYVIAQLVGGALGAALAFAVWPAPEAAVEFAPGVGAAFVVELVVTLILAFVVLNVATSKDNDGNSFYGLAIGGTVTAGAIAVGGISGGGFNPAVALGLAIHGEFAWSNIWLYFVAPLVGAAIAGIAFRLFNTHDLAKAAA